MVVQLATSNNSTIRGKAQRARSIKGAPLPEKLIVKLIQLAEENPTYNFSIGSAGSLSRKKSFFKQNHQFLKFYNKNGDEFEYSDYIKEISNNEIFMAVDFGGNTQEAFVYMYFPFDGAFR